jgi:hypothetical protein
VWVGIRRLPKEINSEFFDDEETIERTGADSTFIGRPRKLTWDTTNLKQYQVYYLRNRDKKDKKPTHEKKRLSLDDQTLTSSQRKALQYRTNNPDKVKKYNNTWKQRNPDKVREYNRKYAAKNRHRIVSLPEQKHD